MKVLNSSVELEMGPLVFGFFSTFSVAWTFTSLYGLTKDMVHFYLVVFSGICVTDRGPLVQGTEKSTAKWNNPQETFSKIDINRNDSVYLWTRLDCGLHVFFFRLLTRVSIERTHCPGPFMLCVRLSWEILSPCDWSILVIISPSSFTFDCSQFYVFHLAQTL